MIKTDVDQYDFAVVANNEGVRELESFKGHVESDHYLSINAADYTLVKNNKSRQWSIVVGLGSNGKALESFPLVEIPADGDLDTLNVKNNPAVDYDFYTFNQGPANITVTSLPTYPLNKNFEMRYGVSIDGGAVNIFNYKTLGRSNEWKNNVLSNAAQRVFKVQDLKAGKHKLTIHMVDPGVILNHIFINLGIAQPFYGLVAPTF